MASKVVWTGTVAQLNGTVRVVLLVAGGATVCEVLKTDAMGDAAWVRIAEADGELQVYKTMAKGS